MARILVIEDDDGLRALLHTVLDVYGYTVVEAANGVDGLRWYQAAPADLVITDLHLPGLEGLAVIRALQRACPGVTVIAMSGCRDTLALAHTLTPHAVEKPFTLTTLLALVQTLVGAPRPADLASGPTAGHMRAEASARASLSSAAPPAPA